MSKSKALLNNTIALYVLNIVKLVFPLLTLPYLTRVLPTDDYGRVVYVRALVSYVQLVIDFGFLLSATKTIALRRENKTQVNRIIGDTMIEKSLLALPTALVYLMIVIINPLMRYDLLFSVLYLVATLVNIGVLDFLFRGIEKMSYITIPYVVAKTLTTALTFVVVHSSQDLLWLPVLELIGNLVAVVISIMFLYHLGYQVSYTAPADWWRDIKESSVYFFSNFATTFFGAFTTVIAGFYLESTQIAFWGICMQFLSAAKAMYNPISNSIYPYMIREKDIRMVHRINRFMTIPMLIVIVIVLFLSEWLMGIVGGDKYRDGAIILRYLLPAFVCSFYSMQYGWPVLGAIQKEKETTATTILASLIQIVGLGILALTGQFTIVTLAICCSISEISLLVFRYLIYLKNRALFFT